MKGELYYYITYALFSISQPQKLDKIHFLFDKNSCMELYYWDHLA